MADDDDENGYRWLNEYEKSWEAITEDQSGSLQTIIDELVHKSKRKRLQVRQGNVRLGMMRHLVLIVDCSRAMMESDLLRPNRLSCAIKLLDHFVEEFFDHNPISQVGLVRTLNKRAEKVVDLSGNSKVVQEALRKMSSTTCAGEPSIQNSLEVASSMLRNIPSHASREVLIVFGSLTTCDPSDVNETIENIKVMNIRSSMIGLSSEVFVFKKLCESTQGLYSIIIDERHFRDLLGSHIPPPEAKTSSEASLLRMGFPKHALKGPHSLCTCHVAVKPAEVKTSGYFCPQCHMKFCGLPVDCRTCGLTLASAPHLARSYQHLFTLPPFEELKLSTLSESRARICGACSFSIMDPAVYVCPTCDSLFCSECDVFLHENLHACPVCASADPPQPPRSTLIVNPAL